MSEFWSRKLGGQQPPPHVPPAPQTGTAWWQTPAHPAVQPHTPPESYPPGDSGAAVSFTYQQLKSMKADQMSQEQMEALAMYELQEAKYNNACPHCGSTNFLPAGAKVGSARMSTDKCFECGAGARSPEPAVGGSSTPGQATRQLNRGAGSYGQHHSALPQQYLPRGGA